MDNNYNTFETNVDDFSFSEEVEVNAIKKLHSALGETDDAVKAYAVNVLIGNVPVKKVSESVGEKFTLYGFHIKNITFKDSGRNGKYIILFGSIHGKPCAYSSSSEKIYEAIGKILYVYGDSTNWHGGISVKIKMNNSDGITAYSLEVV